MGFADLSTDFLVSFVDVDAQTRRFQLDRDFAGVIVMFVGDRKEVTHR